MRGTPSKILFNLPIPTRVLAEKWWSQLRASRRTMTIARLAILLLAASFMPTAALLPPRIVMAAPSSLRPPRLATLRRARVQMLSPSAGSLAAASMLPALLGFWKSEYGVSYAYGTATFLSGILVLPSATTRIATAHAACLALYGLRLNAFLLYRELSIARFREFRDKIEARALEKGGRLSRAPFIASCGLLYLGLAAPLMLTAPASAPPALAGALVCLMYAGWLTAAAGDAWKSVVKARKGEDALVTGGPFRHLRHPNFSGEMLLWGASAAAGAATAATNFGRSVLAACGWLSLSALGWAGISFVLAQAATSLEKRQAALQPSCAAPQPSRRAASRTAETAAGAKVRGDAGLHRVAARRLAGHHAPAKAVACCRRQRGPAPHGRPLAAAKPSPLAARAGAALVLDETDTIVFT